MDRMGHLIGLANRAGHLVTGVGAVREALRSGTVRCIVAAEDVSERAQDKVVRLAQAKNVPVVAGPTAARLGERLGRPPVMVVGVRDRGLADEVVRLDVETAQQ